MAKLMPSLYKLRNQIASSQFYANFIALPFRIYSSFHEFLYLFMFYQQQQKNKTQLASSTDKKNHHRSGSAHFEAREEENAESGKKEGEKKKQGNLPEIPRSISTSKKHSVDASPSHHNYSRELPHIEEKMCAGMAEKVQKSVEKQKTAHQRVKRIGKLSPIKAVKIEIECDAVKPCAEIEMQQIRINKDQYQEKGTSRNEWENNKDSIHQRQELSQSIALDKTIEYNESSRGMKFVINIKSVESEKELQKNPNSIRPQVKIEEKDQFEELYRLLVKDSQMNNSETCSDYTSLPNEQSYAMISRQSQAQLSGGKQEPDVHPKTSFLSVKNKGVDVNSLKSLHVSRKPQQSSHKLESKVNSSGSIEIKSKRSNQSSFRSEMKSNCNNSPRANQFMNLVKKSSYNDKVNQNLLKKQTVKKKTFKFRDKDNKENNKSIYRKSSRDLKLHRYLSYAKEEVAK